MSSVAYHEHEAVKIIKTCRIIQIEKHYHPPNTKITANNGALRNSRYVVVNIQMNIVQPNTCNEIPKNRELKIDTIPRGFGHRICEC